MSYRLMVAGPLILLAAVAVNGRTVSTLDDKAIFGQRKNESLAAYVPLLRSSEILASSECPSTGQELQKVADDWIENYDKGRLQTIMPVDFETPSQDTVLGDIRVGKMTVIYGLETRAAYFDKLGQFEKEALSLVQAVKLASINKYTDFQNVHQFGLIQGNCLARLTKIGTRLRPLIRASCFFQLRKVEANEVPLMNLVTNSREIHCAALARKNQASVIKHVVRGYKALEDVVLTKSDASVAKLRQVAMASWMPTELTAISTVARLSINTDNTYHAQMARAKRALQSVK